MFWNNVLICPNIGQKGVNKMDEKDFKSKLNQVKIFLELDQTNEKEK